AAAVWALGLIHEGKASDKLVAAVEGRLNDVQTMPPEDARVRRMAAIALGRLGAKETLPSLRIWCPDQEPSTDSVTTACGWAIERLIGEALKSPKPIRKVWRDSFLTPLD